MTDEGDGFMGVGGDKENVGCVLMEQIMRDPTNAVVAVDNNKLGICCIVCPEPSRGDSSLRCCCIYWLGWLGGEV
jgi:hypothetical protein